MEEGRDQNETNDPNGVSVSNFDCSADNFLASMDSINERCGLPTDESFDESEIERFSSMISFLKEWKYFVYESKTIKFTCEIGSGQVKEDFDEISLPQFSSAAVPKMEKSSNEPRYSDSDFLLHAGGLVWAMDWCPTYLEKSEYSIECEYLAVAVHPPGSTYHKIGVPLAGRGIIQIWCLLTSEQHVEFSSPRRRKIRKAREKLYDSDGKVVSATGRPIGRPKGSYKKRPQSSDNVNGQMESSPPSNNLILSYGEVIPLSSLDLEETLLERPAALHRKLENLAPKRRWRPRKKPSLIANELVPVSENIIAVPVSADLSMSLDPSLQSYERLSVGENSESDMIRREESSLPRRRERPRKKPLPSVDESAQASGLNLVNDAPTSRGPKTLSENVKSLPSVDDSNIQLSSVSTEYKKDPSLLSSSRAFGTLPGNTVLSFVPGGSVNQAESLEPKRRGRPKRNPIGSDTTNIGTSGSMVQREETTGQRFQIPKDIALPKIVFSLAHMGKVAWDVKWRPSHVDNSEGKQNLGYLAVLLGNGSLEVWEIPLPGMVKILYTSSRSDDTDPRFLKLKPIFRCSKVKCGERQSLPLTVEWSSSAPHDLILTGCHDGTVAVWKFSSQLSGQDVRPLLCFSAESVPIRCLAWAPYGSNTESANLIATAGHEGLKFWDLRNPFRPLWEFNPVQRVVLSIDWLNDPSCLIMSFDDGALRLLSLLKVANEVPITGELVGPLKQPGLHTYLCSHFAIWGSQVSRASGLVAYCTAEGSVCCFQLTTNAVEKDPCRYRESHFLCGSLSVDDNALKIKSRLPNIPLPGIPFQKIPHGLGDAPLFSLLSEANQARGANLPVSAFSGAEPTVMKHKSKPGNNAASEGTVQNIGNAQKILELPAKKVAMHKVRWNMNKGSQRWLCYGGAGGIIRCQTISL